MLPAEPDHNHRDGMGGIGECDAALTNCLLADQTARSLSAHTENRWAETDRWVETMVKSVSGKHESIGAK